MIELAVRVHFGAGIPKPELFETVVLRVLADDRLGFRFKAIEGGAKLSPDPVVAAREAADTWVDRKFGATFILAQQDSRLYPSFSSPRRHGPASALLTIPMDGADIQAIEELMVDWVETCSGTYATASLLDSDLGVNDRGIGFDVRAYDMCEVNRVERPEDGRGCSPHMGLAGVAQRMVLGRPFVELIGEDRLAALNPVLGSAVGDGLWLLSATPADEFDQWNVDRYCDGEASIVECLGSEYFFDPVSKRLPEKRPEIEVLAPFAVKVYDPWEKTWSDV